MNGKLVLPSDNQTLSTQELSRARKICRTVKKLVEDRDSYITNQSAIVDKNFAIPDANWSPEAPNIFIEAYNKVVTGDERALQYLRAYTGMFSGYALHAVSPGCGLDLKAMLAPTYNEELMRNSLVERNLPWVPHWEEMVSKIPDNYLIKPANLFGEIGHLFSNVIVNYDTIQYQERINLLYESGIIDYLKEKSNGVNFTVSKKDSIVHWFKKNILRKNTLSILEIGGGFGLLAHCLKTIFPNANYTIIDLPECLLFSSLYLGLSRPDVAIGFGDDIPSRSFSFVPNYMAQQLNQEYDLVINTLSMSEMSAYQVQIYADLIKNKWLGKSKGLFFEQNQDNRHMGLNDAKNIISKTFPYRETIRFETMKSLFNGVADIWSADPINLQRPSLDSVAK